MNAHHAKRYWSRLSVLSVCLILLSGSAGLFAQPAVPPPSQSQVIAQGVDMLVGGSMRWYVEELVVPSESDQPLRLGAEFIYISEGQVQVGNDGTGDQLISQDQATYVFRGDPQSAHLIGDEPVSGIRIMVYPSIVDYPEDHMPLFDAEPGRYNQQLTRGILNGDQVDTFSPVNDLPYLVISTSGTLMIDAPGVDPGEGLEAGFHDQLTGDITLSAGSETPATYLIASIGERLPDLQEVEPVVVGDVLVYFWECGPESYAVSSTDQCMQVTDPVEFSLVRYSGEVVSDRVDSFSPSGTGWVAEGLEEGEWRVILLPQDEVEPPAFSILRNATEREGSWYVTVTANETTVVSVMMYTQPPQAQETGSLTVTYMECPGYWGADMGFGDCWIAPVEPNLTLRGTGFQFSVHSDAGWIDDSSYFLESLPVGTYQLELVYMEGWDGGYTVFLGDAYHDGTAYKVDILPGTVHSVMIVRVIPEIDPEPAALTGYVVITQDECETWEAESPCVPALEPWDIRLTNVETGEVLFMSEWGYPAESGVWMMQVPIGAYTVDLPNTGGWQVEFPGWIEVFNDQETPVYIRGNPQP